MQIDIAETTDQKQKIQAFFDRDQGWQGTIYDKPKDHYTRLMARRQLYNFQMLDNLNICKSGIALDVGCGSGVYLEELSKRGCKAFGIDMSFQMLKASHELLKNNNGDISIHLIAGDIEKIPLKSEQFDLVLCVGVLGYLLQDEKALLEIRRILKPNGVVLINVKNMLDLSNLDYVLRRKMRAMIFRRKDTRIKEMQPGVSMTSEWLVAHSPTHYRHKSYNLWKLERFMKNIGYRLVTARTFGYDFRIIRRLKFLPELLLTTLEINMEKLFHKIRIPYFPYSGQVYIGIFQKVCS